MLACGALGTEVLEHLGFIKYLPEALRREEGVSSCLLRADGASGMSKDSGFPCSLLESSLCSQQVLLDCFHGCLLVAVMGEPRMYPAGSRGIQESLI